MLVSTHSRPKAAANITVIVDNRTDVSTHSRPKAAAINPFIIRDDRRVSTHSRPKAAAMESPNLLETLYGFNTQPPEGGC